MMEILGMDGAYLATKAAGPNNLMISAPLLVELVDKISALKNLIAANKIADESGYVDGEGWISDWLEMTEEVEGIYREWALEQQAQGIERLITRRNTIEAASMDGLYKREAAKLRDEAKSSS